MLEAAISFLTTPHLIYNFIGKFLQSVSSSLSSGKPLYLHQTFIFSNEWERLEGKRALQRRKKKTT
jgi:hypothetical protein